MGGDIRRRGDSEGVEIMAGDAAGLIVAVGGGTMGGVARKSMAGEGPTLGGLDGVVVAAGGVEGLAFGCGVGERRVRTVGDATGVALAAAAGRAVGVALARAAGVALADAVGLIVGVALALAAGLGLVATVALGTGVALAREAGVGLDATGAGEAVAAAGVALAAGVVAPAAVGAGVAVVDAVSVGFTNRFEGPFGGGVASVLILVRARSAAERSAIVVHPFSTTTSATRSFIRRGRGISRISTMSGTETSSSLP
jgi:hypothetical protein